MGWGISFRLDLGLQCLPHLAKYPTFVGTYRLDCLDRYFRHLHGVPVIYDVMTETNNNQRHITLIH
jgi:hypothetical protein